MANKLSTRFRTTLALRVIPWFRRLNYWLIAQVAILTMRALRQFPPDSALNFAGRQARRFGPLFGRHRTALSNLRNAYPEKSEDEIKRIALEMWDNMGRLGAEYIFLDKLFEIDPDGTSSRVEIVGEEYFRRMASEAKPHIIFTAHLGNFESLAIAAGAAGLKVTSLFRPPNNPYIAEFIFRRRNKRISDLLASHAGVAFTLAAILDEGGNIGVLVDQRFINGITTTFFGRTVENNPIVPMLARRFECDVYPARSIRLPGNRYRMIIEDKLDIPRNEQGDIEIFAACQQLNDVVERWVRDDPGQWTWFHKRWQLSRFRRAMRRPKQAVAAASDAPPDQ